MIQGDVSTFQNALGAREGDPRLEAALAFVGGEYEVSGYTDVGVDDRKYLEFTDRGVDFSLSGGEVSSVFIRATGEGKSAAYDGWETLIEGIDQNATPDDVRRELGEPIRASRSFLIYEADPGYIHFEFSDETLSLVTVMRQLIGGAPTNEESAKPANETHSAKAEGEVAVFLRALGTGMYSSEHMAVMVLGGAAMESRTEKRGRDSWEYQHHAATGVTVQFKNEVMVGALIPLQSSDGAAVYPTPEKLIDGLPLPASREAVASFFGAPRRSSQYMDLYLVDDRYLRFDYEGDQNTSLSVVMPEVEP